MLNLMQGATDFRRSLVPMPAGSTSPYPAVNQREPFKVRVRSKSAVESKSRRFSEKKSVFSIIAGKSTMTPSGKCRKFRAEGTWPRRALPCLVPGSICQMPRKASRDPKICPKPRSFAAAATSRIALVPGAASRVSATAPADESCTTSAIWSPVGRATSTSSTRSIAVPQCRKYFNVDMSDLALPKSHYTHRVVAMAVRLVVEDGLPYRAASWHLWRDHRVFVPYATIQNWVEAGGKKGGAAHMRTTYLDAALDDFSGYIAADELYDGPFCVLSIVDNRTFRRLIYEVLGPRPGPCRHQARSSARFQAALQRRGLVLQGITTDGSNLYPEPISKVFGDVSHQLCEFHVIKELTKAVLHAVAKVRKELAATKPKLGRGRPSSAAARKAAPAGQADRTESRGPVSASLSVRAARSDSRPAADPDAASPAGGPSCERFEVSWMKCTASSIVAAAATPRWRNWPGCGVACGVSSGSARPCRKLILSQPGESPDLPG